MDAIEAILTRRSIRSYSNKAVSPQLIDTLLRAAMFAPSAGNEQPWQFVVIDDRRMLDEIADLHINACMAKRAPLAVLVCGDLTAEKYKGFWVQDCTAAIENMLLAAHASGLGAVWSGLYPVEDHIAKFSDFFRLPEHIIPLAIVVIGYPAETPVSVDRYQANRIHKNRW